LAESAKPITQTALIITFIVAFSKILGIFRETVIAYMYGAGAVTDAYAVASRMVATAGLLVSVYLGTTFVPAYVRMKEKQSEKEALRFTNDTLGLCLAVTVFLMVAMQITAPLILKITGFSPEQFSLALTAARITLFQLPLLVFIGVFSSYLTARKSFWGPNLIGFPLSVTVISVCLIAGTQSGVIGLATANLLGFAAQLLMLFIWLRKEKYHYRFSLRLNTPEIRSGMKLFAPALLGSAIGDLNAWVNTIIATHLGEGNAAAIGFAALLLTFVMGLIVLPVANIVYSCISEYAAKNDTEKMLSTLWRTIRMIFFIVLPIVVIAIPFSFDIVRIVYQRGQFTAEAALLTGSALMWYMPALLGMTLHAFLLRFFYVLQDTKTPMFCGIASVFVSISLSIVLSRVMGIGGITLASSIGSGLSALLLLIALRLKIGPLGFGETAIDIFKMLICAIPCALAAMGIGFLLHEQSALIRFPASAFAGGVAYLVPAFLLKEMAFIDLMQILRGLFITARQRST
jgi:putative peptidoglycan lipid II flippase